MDETEQDVHVLHVDDDTDFLDLTKTMLEHRFSQFTVETETSPKAALDALPDSTVDCVVLDYHMSEMDGLEFLQRVREFDEELPIVFFTGKGSEELASEALAAGATDYLRKGADANLFTVLGNRIVSLVVRRRAEAAAHEADRQVREVYERISTGFFAVDESWEVTYANERGADTFDTDVESLVGRSLADALPGYEGSELDAHLRGSMEAQQSVSARTFYQPLERWLEVYTYPSETGLSVFLEDVTEEVVAQEELEELRRDLEISEEKFSSLQQKLSRPPSPFR